MKGLEDQKSGQRVAGPGKMERKCRSCGASTEFRGHTLFSWGGLIMPSETRFCPRCELVNIFVIEDLGDDGAPAPDLPAFCAKRLRVEKHEEFIEVMCPRCEASMFFVQHLDVSFRGAGILVESWICECGTTLEIAKDSEIAIREEKTTSGERTLMGKRDLQKMAPRRSRGKGYVNPCWVCGERRHTDGAHFPKAKRPGKEGKIQIHLCPTHHRLLDDGRLSKLEYEAIMKHPLAEQKLGRTFSNVDDFVSWAFEEGYDYALENLRNKFWEHEPVEYSCLNASPEKRPEEEKK